MADHTQILNDVDSDDPSAAEQIVSLVYDELRKLAAARLAQEPTGQTLQTTALVHEAYLRLVGGQPAPEWEGRRHFFAAAAEAMRRILVERARRKGSVKHGGKLRRLDLDAQSFVDERLSDDLLALDEALAELKRHDPRAAQVVNLRYFAGMSLNDIADVMQVGRRTVDRLWALAKAWLYDQPTSD